MDSRLQPRSISSLDYSRLFDEGCVKTRLKQLTQGFMTKLEFEEKDKLREKEFREALKSKKPPKPFQWRELSQGERNRRYLEKARKEAEKVLELERRAFVKSREQWLLDRLTFIRDKLRMVMFAMDETGKFVKPTFVSRVVHTGSHSFHENYVTFFGTDKDRDRMRSINDLRRVLSQVAYMIPYSSDEIKALRKEIGELVTPDHYETWHNNQLVQVYGGHYTKEDKGLTSEEWRKAVKKRAEKIIAERKKVAETQQKKEEEEKTEKEQKVVKITKEKARSQKVNHKRGTSKVVKNTEEKETS